jgi:hypothetical protein
VTLSIVCAYDSHCLSHIHFKSATMPFRKLRKSLKRLFSFKARRVVPPNGNDNLPQVTETERASKVSQVPSLETLPAELRRHILLIVEIDSLKALVQASPIYFHQYQLDRKTILCGSLEATLGNALADAYAVQMSSSSKLAPPNNPEEAEDILQYYHTILAQTSLNPLHKLLSMEEARSMVKFHCSIVQPLMQCFVKRTSSNLTKTKGVEIGETFSKTGCISLIPRIEECLSRTNDTQLMWAFYRFQYCCNVYCLESYDSVSLNSRIATPARILNYFLYQLRPCSASCLLYFYDECRQIFAHDLCKRSPGIDHQPRRRDDNTHSEWVSFDSENWRHCGLKNTTFSSESKDNSDGLLTTPILRGLELLHLVNSRIKNDEDLIMVKFCMIQRFCGIPGRNNLDFDDFLRRKLVPHVDCTDPFAGALIQR